MQERTRAVYIKEIIKETDTVKRFSLAACDNSPLPAFSPGAHITTYLQTHAGLLERHYSLTNHPDDRDAYQIAVKLSETSKGGSFFWHHKLQPGDRLEIGYPKNHFLLSQRAKHHVFYAAGIGITPFLSMMAELKQTGQSFELHYGAKTKEQCAFYAEILGKYKQEARFYFSQGTPAEHIPLDTLLNHRIGTHIYICGPEGLLNSIKDAAFKIGYPKKSVHFERFTAPLPKLRQPFRVKLVDHNLELEVSETQSLLEVLIENNLPVPFSCRVGRCGTCQIEVIHGEAEHLDSFLSEEEQEKSMLCCVSRAKSRVLTVKV